MSDAAWRTGAAHVARCTALALACMLAALSSMPRRVTAQTESPTLASRRRAVAIAMATAKAASDAMRADSVQRAQRAVFRTYGGLAMRGDTTRFPPAFLAAIDSAFARVFAVARPVYGVAVDTMMRGLGASLAERYGSADAERAGGVPKSALLTGPYGHSVRVSTASPNRDELQQAVADWLSLPASERLPDAIRHWQSSRIMLFADPSITRRIAYLTMSSGRYAFGRACLDGSLAACRTALAIVPRNDTLGAWFDAGTRRTMVRTTELRAARHGDDHLNVLRHACVEGGSDSACRVILSGLGLPAPTTRDAREDILKRALAHGGPNAYGRLVAAGPTEEVAVVLERVAGVALDSVIAEWRRDVIASREPSPKPNPREWLVGIVFGAVIVGASARRRP